MKKSDTAQRETWIHLIAQLLEQADTLTVRRAYYLLRGFVGKEKTVPELDTE